MPDKDLLDLEARRHIVEFVKASPGMHMRAMAESLGMAVSTIEYHTYQLVRHGYLSTREEGGLKAFYPVGGMDRRDKDVLYMVRQQIPRRVCTFLLINPGATPKELVHDIGVSAPTLSFHLKKMRANGILREEPAGRTKHLFITDEERVANVLVTYRRSFLDDVVDRFTAAWSELRPPESKGNPPHQGAVPPSVADLMPDEPEGQAVPEGATAQDNSDPGRAPEGGGNDPDARLVPASAHAARRVLGLGLRIGAARIRRLAGGWAKASA